MTPSLNKIDAYLEIGKKRTFAGAMDWPGWCRSGRDEASALEAMSTCAGEGCRQAELAPPITHSVWLPLIWQQ